MAYIGNTPAESFASFEKQVFTIVNSQTAYTLSHSVVNENDIRLVVNNVVQEPGSGKAYTASGTTLTLSAALVNGTDEMYCVFLGRALQTVNAPNASVGSDQTAPTIITGQTAETSIATDDLILLSDTSASGALKKMTQANFVSGVGGANTPYFFVRKSANQNVTSGAITKVELDVEDLDSANAFDSSTNYRYTPQTSGKYFFFATGRGVANSGTLNYCNVMIRKNGTAGVGNSFVNSATEQYTSPGNSAAAGTSVILTMNGSSDYVEMYMQVGGTSPYISYESNGNQTIFGGYKIIE